MGTVAQVEQWPHKVLLATTRIGLEYAAATVTSVLAFEGKPPDGHGQRVSLTSPSFREQVIYEEKYAISFVCRARTRRA